MPYVRSQRVSEEYAKNFGVDWSCVVQDVRHAIARSRAPRADFSLCDLVPANDDGPADLELDALLAGLDDAIPADELDLDAALADLPLDFPAVRTPVVTDLDGNPVDEEPAPTPRRVSKNPKKGGSKPRKSFSRDMRNIKRKEALSRAASYIIAANDPVLSVGEPLTPSSPSQKPHIHGVMSVTDDEKDQVRKLLPSTPKGTSKSTEKRRRADENDTRKPRIGTSPPTSPRAPTPSSTSAPGAAGSASPSTSGRT